MIEESFLSIQKRRKFIEAILMDFVVVPRNKEEIVAHLAEHGYAVSNSTYKRWLFELGVWKQSYTNRYWIPPEDLRPITKYGIPKKVRRRRRGLE